MQPTRGATGLCKRSSLRALLALALAACLVACSGSSDDDEAAPPKTPPSPLEKLTVMTYEGFGPSSPPGSECALESHPSTQRVDASSHELTWDYCALNAELTHAALEQGSRTLTDSEFSAVMDAFARVQATHNDNCGADADVVTLDVQNEDGIDRYANDFYSGCPGELQAGRTFASGLENLANVTRSLANTGESASDPAPTPAPFERLTLVKDPDYAPYSYPDQDCSLTTYPSTDVVTSSHELSWDYCAPSPPSGHVEVHQGSRTLTTAEFESVTAAFANVQPTQDVRCGVDVGQTRLDVQTDDGVGLYADCSFGSSGDRQLANGVGELRDLVASLRGNP